MSMFDKFKEIIGGSDYDEDFDDIEEVDEEEEVEEVEPIISKQRGNKVVNIHNSASAKVMVVKPNSYDEAREIAEAIKNRKIVVVNTTAMEMLCFRGSASRSRTKSLFTFTIKC